MTSSDIICFIIMVTIFVGLIILNYTVIKPWGKTTKEHKKHHT